MGGSGTIGGPLGPEAEERDDVLCEALDFQARLQSVNRTVVGSLSIGDVLGVVIQPGVTVETVVAIPPGSGGAPAGSITDRVLVLLRCLHAGVPFKASVLSITGGSVRVRVYSDG